MRGAAIGIFVGSALVAIAAGCQPPPARTPVTTPGTPVALTGEWKLVLLAGYSAPLGAGRRPATIAFDTATSKVSGFAGCNRFSGGYTSTGDSLRFGPLALTKMACEEGMELEHQLTDALSRTTRFEFVGRSLTLLADADSLATFERPEKP
jgi:heat shock protein HslJ